MIRPAFSTTACPDWTLQEVVEHAATWGFEGVEMRSFGRGGVGPGGGLASDPGMTAGSKVRALFEDAGLDACGIATGISFDAPIIPPVIGRVLPSFEASVVDAKHALDVAEDCAASYVRVYPFKTHTFETQHAVRRRIVERLKKASDHASRKGCVLVLENAGAFPRAEDIAEIIVRVGSPNLFAGYDIQSACLDGDDPIEGVKLLARRLAFARVRDLQSSTPVALGEGDLPVRDFIRAVSEHAKNCWTVFSWDRLWLPELDHASDVMPGVPKLLYEWASPGARANHHAA
ncbi:MAG: TIM barrel protein [Planctomycetota bacterium]